MNKKSFHCHALVNEASFITGLKLHQLTRNIDGVIMQNYLKQSEEAVLNELECVINEMEEELEHCEEEICTVEAKYSILSSNNDDNRYRVHKSGFTECKYFLSTSEHSDYKDAAVSELYRQRGDDMWQKLMEYRKRANELLSSESKKESRISVWEDNEMNEVQQVEESTTFSKTLF